MKKILLIMIIVFYAYGCSKVDDASLGVENMGDFVSTDKEVKIPNVENQPNY